MFSYEDLNPQQKEAVMHTEGPLLILAGAGSGKTRVLTNRISYMLEECGIRPWNIMAITFTNKAAGEMRDRVSQTGAFGAESVWVATFHSSCVRILRRHIDRIGYGSSFTIYDSDDSKTVIKGICRDKNLDTKQFRERSLQALISNSKNAMIRPEEYEAINGDDWYEKTVAEIYREYEKRLQTSNALDFDDLLLKTVELFEACPDVLEYYQDRFRYIMVDEYQDTNAVQFEIVSRLAQKHRNLCVVGDDDQSIYRFRGADIENILGFERVFPDAHVIRLEQNYRSTQNILNAANAVIANNTRRKEKILWTDKGEGKKVVFRQFPDAFGEAEFIVGDIRKKTENGSASCKDFAVLYRTNAQSRMIEEKMLLANMPYQLVGGVQFYARKEIKDLLSYLKTVENGQDDLAAKRIINVPKRGIGPTTVQRISDYAAAHGMSFIDAVSDPGLQAGIGRAGTKVKAFSELIARTRGRMDGSTVPELLQYVIDETGYVLELKMEQTDEADARIENIEELQSKAAAYQEDAEDPTLAGFLEEVALVAGIDDTDDSDDRVLLMTLHSAKGLEFPHVYICGMEEGIFPGSMTVYSGDPMDMEEERRLCYVGITRAKDELTLTCAKKRLHRGEVTYNRPSRFLDEIPAECLDRAARRPAPKREDRKQTKAYQQMRETFHTRTAQAAAPNSGQILKADHLDYGVGDTVSHIKFGTGVVTGIKDGGRDYEVTVNFEKVGVKKMFAGFAKLKKI